MIANALDKDGKFTTAQVSRKLKQLGLYLPLKSSGNGKRLLLSILMAILDRKGYFQMERRHEEIKKVLATVKT